ncbi:unnamed protein product [Lactuca virosa]|uniref:Uncharacterized protein n=1 Tax=Lactuca virosa TaxID=75947 RepID=A0AAU9MMS2_9ASTR|nr:unnamed protein product [Lactuca virosa]
MWTTTASATVGSDFKDDVPPIEAGVRGSGVASGKVVSHHRSTTVDSDLEEDGGGSSISRRLRRKSNIDPLFSKSPIVIEIADIDDPQAVETAGLRRPGEPGIMGAYSVPPSVPGDALSVAACMAAGVEKGKQVARMWSAGNSPGSSDPDAMAQSIDEMHDIVRAFAETDFASYLCLGELDLVDLFQLCSEEEERIPDGGVGGTASTQPRQG